MHAAARESIVDAIHANDTTPDVDARRQRTLSTVERDALQSVLDVVERETDSEHTKGMSRFTFFLGLTYIYVHLFFALAAVHKSNSRWRPFGSTRLTR